MVKVMIIMTNTISIKENKKERNEINKMVQQKNCYYLSSIIKIIIMIMPRGFFLISKSYNFFLFFLVRCLPQNLDVDY